MTLTIFKYSIGKIGNSGEMLFRWALRNNAPWRKEAELSQKGCGQDINGRDAYLFYFYEPARFRFLMPWDSEGVIRSISRLRSRIDCRIFFDGPETLHTYR